MFGLHALQPSIALAAIIGLGAACGAPEDPFTSGSARATVTGLVTDRGGNPISGATIHIACSGGGSPVSAATDTTGHYVANLDTDSDPFDGGSGRLLCHFSEPAAGDGAGAHRHGVELCPRSGAGCPPVRGSAGALGVLGGLGWLTFMYAPLATRVYPCVVAIGLLGAAAVIIWLLVFGVREQEWKEQARNRQRPYGRDRVWSRHMIPDLRDTLLDTWRTSNRLTVYLIEHLPPELWTSAIPGAPRRTVRMIAGHIHNSRCMWTKTLGQELGVAVPRGVDRRRVGRKELVPALGRSSRGILRLLAIGYDRGGTIPISSSYVWRNLPLDVGHVLAYFVAHEAHHRGQIVLVARALGHRLPSAVTAGLWQWTKRAAEAKAERP